MVLQYSCDSNANDPIMAVTLRDGTTTTQVSTTDTGDPTRGMHESTAYYQECATRNRNFGLYLADQDQNLQGNQAIYTRQNPDGTRYGLECSEERDYYPYWYPAPWVDVAYTTDRTDMCNFIQSNSQNMVKKYRCVDTPDSFNPTILNSNASTCEQNGGNWLGTSWYPIPGAPDCFLGNWTRENHLGNGRVNQPLTYNWTLPTASQLLAMNFVADNATNTFRCVMRMRYNISTGDYDPWNTNSSYNSLNAADLAANINNRQAQTQFPQPISDDPTVDVHADLQGLTLALNTNQYGRTFQDRSHIFYIKTRPSSLANQYIQNLGVRGKRGNIVQVYPGVEYDFVPNRLTVNTTDFVHIQWTGSNTHTNNPNSEDAGDGQGGDAGQGTDGTDRSNFVMIGALNETYPLPLDKFTTLFNSASCWNFAGTSVGSSSGGAVNIDCAILLASSGYYLSAAAAQSTTAQANSAGAADDLDPLLDNAPPSLVGGILMQVSQPGIYFYACTRNNNFSNRTQKGTLIIV